MKKYIPPTDFYKYAPKKEYVNLNIVKRKLVDSKDLGITFLTLHLNNPITCTGLTEELGRILENSYRQKTYRLLCELVKLGIINFKKYSEINEKNPSDCEKEIIRKHKMFLASISNPWENDFHHTVYYFISERGEEVLDFIAKKFNFTENPDD